LEFPLYNFNLRKLCRRIYCLL